MEIISYVGFDNRNYNDGFENAIEHFTSFFRKRRNSIFSGKDSGTDSSLFIRHEMTENAFKTSRGTVSPAAILKKAAEAFDFLCKNPAMTAKIAAVIAAAITASVMNIKLIDFSGKVSSPLILENSSSLDIEKLNSIMSSFALEEIPDYNPDGTLIEKTPSVPLLTVFSQPVTFRTYKVQSGDTISGITKKFGLRNISTLIAVNDIDNVRQLAAGQKLKIPSTDGLYYTVKSGNSLAGISAKYSVTIEDLLDVNELDDAELKIGQRLFIPGAKLDASALQNAMGELFKCPLTARFRYTSMFGPRIDPISGTKSSHTGIDLACPQGTPITASSSGTVSFVGYSNIYGNYIIIKHSNGYQTLYAHMSKTLAKKGQWVSQGTRIGLVGSTGYSTGPHLHFSVYKNSSLVDPMTVLK